eukprot:GEMP01035633.1.p1 GENE.GEMP01035633.1~~GEMP01035633.1.p1  ORF type:complete len:456 (+),score=84.90 GEMP01035633.1:171-1538(+)
MGKDKHKKHSMPMQQPQNPPTYNVAPQYLSNLPTAPTPGAPQYQQPYTPQYQQSYPPQYPSQPQYQHQHSGASSYGPQYQQQPGQQYPPPGSAGVPHTPAAPSQQMMIMCANCSIKLYAPPGGGLFKCPSCNTTQRLPSEMEGQLRSTYGIACNVPGCKCQGFAVGLPAGDQDHSPSKSSEHHHSGGCGTCGHKKSMHKIGPEKAKVHISLPRHWEGDLTKSTRKQVTKEVKKAVQDLMDETWKDVATKDRLGDKTVPTKYEVVQVLKNQNPKIWNQYARKREIIREEMSTHTSQDHLVPKTENFLKGCKETEPLRHDCNEMFLFHGTKPSAADSIAENDFKMSFSGSNRGTLLGQGIYFAESSSKSDEYAQDDQDGLYQGLYATLLCRIVMGNYNYNEEHQPNADELSNSCSLGKYHSVLGDREKIRGTFREFVVFDSDQAYPEFIVIYRRIFA